MPLTGAQGGALGLLHWAGPSGGALGRRGGEKCSNGGTNRRRSSLASPGGAKRVRVYREGAEEKAGWNRLLIQRLRSHWLAQQIASNATPS